MGFRIGGPCLNKTLGGTTEIRTHDFAAVSLELHHRSNPNTFNFVHIIKYLYLRICTADVCVSSTSTSSTTLTSRYCGMFLNNIGAPATANNVVCGKKIKFF